VTFIELVRGSFVATGTKIKAYLDCQYQEHATSISRSSYESTADSC
jgi:hypothetical protein